jgi:hypothetical protein
MGELACPHAAAAKLANANTANTIISNLRISTPLSSQS